MFPGKQVVQKAEADRPVVGKSSSFLSCPFRIDWVGRTEDRKITGACLARRWNQEQLCRIGRITLYALPRGVVKSIELRSIPPSRVGVAHGLRRAHRVSPPTESECIGRRVLGDIAFVDSVIGAAT